MVGKVLPALSRLAESGAAGLGSASQAHALGWRTGHPWPYPIPATMFTVIAMMNTLKKNAITLCSSATRRR